jgi:hypothetical protein
MLHFFPMLLDWSKYFFLCFLSIYSFFATTPLSPFARLQEQKSFWNLEYLFFVDGWHVLRNSRCRS